MLTSFWTASKAFLSQRRVIVESMVVEPNDEQRLRDRKESIFWSRGLLENIDNWCVIDTETTGLNPRFARVVEITVLGANGDIIFDSLINPGISIPAEVSQIHGISDHDVVEAPTISGIWNELAATIEGKILVAYNSQYDRSILQFEALRHGLEPIASVWDCAMKRYSAYVGAWDSRFGNYRFQKLPSAGHRSRLDCKVTLDLLRAMSETQV